MNARILCLSLFFLIFLFGCSKVTLQGYNELEAGMSYESVVYILGKPDNCTERLKAQSCVWGDEEKYIRGTFVAGKLVLYSSEGLE